MRTASRPDPLRSTDGEEAEIHVGARGRLQPPGICTLGL